MKTVTNCTAAFFLSALACLSNADDSTPILHPVEAVCIDYQLDGQMQQGTTTRCHRDYGYEQYEIQDFTAGFGGFTQTQNMHNITIGNTIYAINLQTNTGTKTINPMYDGLVTQMQNADPDELVDTFMSAMGFSPTGASNTIDGISCNVYNSSMMGMVCMTDNGLMLEQSFMGNTQTAVNVAIGDGGDDANYTLYMSVPISDGPDLSSMPNLQDLMNLPQQQ